MALRAATTNVSFIKWDEVEDGSVICGFYLERKPSSNPKFKDTHYVEIVSNNPEVHGKQFGLGGTANLERAFDQVRPGWYFELKYLGKIVLENGVNKGANCHRFELLYDDERIHPLFSGNAAARESVEYKNSAAAEPAALQAAANGDAYIVPTHAGPAEQQQQPAANPALVKPEPAAAAVQQPAAAPATKKRSLF